MQNINEPKFLSKHFNFTRVFLVLIVTLLSGAIFGTIGYIIGMSNQASLNNSNTSRVTAVKFVTKLSPTPTVSVIPTAISTNATSNWKTYKSTTDNASFKYPANWIITKPAIESNFQNADQIGLQSPSGEVKISWVSELGGFGGSCTTDCPLITIIDKTAIGNSKNLYVVSGTVTSEGKMYEPFLAVQDNNGLVTTRRSMAYDMFSKKPFDVLFSTSDAYAGGPNLSQSEATAWFNKPEVQEAKQILLSLTIN